MTRGRPTVSDDRTRPLGPFDNEPDPVVDNGRARGIQIGLIIGVTLLVVAVLGIRVLGGGDGDPVIDPSPTGTEELSDEPTDDPTPTPSESESPTQESTDEPRAATDADAAQFSESYRPFGAQAVQSVTADVDGDGEKEVVVASIHSDASRLDIARWTGRSYEVVYTGRGGGAERIDDFKVTDYTGDGVRDIMIMQSVGAQGHSLSVWGYNGQAFAPQRATGGCWDGSHTYGVIGASIRSGEIRATCDASPLPTSAWPSDVYRWNAQAGGWTYERTED